MAPKNFTVYRSSAGSGKTFTLVKEYLRIALSDTKRFRNILAITFTNKAAAEMKNRVLKYLKEMQEERTEANKTTHDFLLPLLAKETSLSKEELKLRAAAVMTLILHNYSDFAITTIDSLMHRVVRTFTFDLRLSAGFDIEMDTDKLLLQSVAALISRAGSDKELTEVLVEFVKQQTEDEKSFNIEHDIFSLSKSTFNLEDTRQKLGELQKLSLTDLMGINKQMIAFRKDFEQRIHNIASENYRIITNEQINLSSFYHGSTGIGGYFKNLSDKHYDKIPGNSYVRTTIEEDKWLATKCSQEDAAAIEKNKETLKQGYEAIQQLISVSYATYIRYGLVSSLFYPMALLNEVSKTLTEIKQNDNLLLISDFNYLINKVVENEPVPFIYERMGSRFRHFMIDEFQDTSILQWHNLIPLLENMLADGHFCMLVGDGKQAIYRWRNGEVEQFSSLPDIYKKPALHEYDQREQALQRNFAEAFLETNFRSGKVIVDFNNQLYEFLSESLDTRVQPIYHKQQQQVPANHSGGYVRMDFTEFENETEQLPEYLQLIISEVLEDGHTLKDIGILCRSNKQATMIASGLLRRGIAVVSAESLLLDGTPVIGFLMATLQYLSKPEDSLARASMTRYLWYAKKIQGSDLHSCLQLSKESHTAFRTFLEKQSYPLSVLALLKMPLYDLCEELIRHFGLQSPADPYIQFFLEAVNDFIKQGGSDIQGFLLWWEEKKSKLSITVPEGLDAVNVVTIHKSKGLEFPVVIFPARDSLRKNTIPRVWADFNDPAFPLLTTVLLPTSSKLKDTPFEPIHDTERIKTRLDFINLLYVATTRAARRLYIQCGTPSKDPKKMSSCQDIFAAYLQHTGLWQETQMRYIFGERETKTIPSPVLSSEMTTARLISEPWQERILLSLQYPQSEWEEASAEKKIWGNLLHTALSRIIHTSDAPHIMEQMLHEGLISEAHKAPFNASMQQLLGHDELSTLLDEEGEVLTEAEILSAEGKSYRPDRVTITASGVTLIDYKTGDPLPAHKDQIDHYSSLLTEMGYANIKKALVYIGDAVHIELL